MKKLTQPNPHSSAPDRFNFGGLDAAQKNIVNHGLDVQAEFNTVCAVEYLKSYDIDAEVIERVLLKDLQN